MPHARFIYVGSNFSGSHTHDEPEQHQYRAEEDSPPDPSPPRSTCRGSGRCAMAGRAPYFAMAAAYPANFARLVHTQALQRSRANISGTNTAEEERGFQRSWGHRGQTEGDTRRVHLETNSVRPAHHRSLAPGLRLLVILDRVDGARNGDSAGRCADVLGSPRL